MQGLRNIREHAMSESQWFHFTKSDGYLCIFILSISELHLMQLNIPSLLKLPLL